MKAVYRNDMVGQIMLYIPFFLVSYVLKWKKNKRSSDYYYTTLRIFLSKLQFRICCDTENKYVENQYTHDQMLQNPEYVVHKRVGIVRRNSHLCVLWRYRKSFTLSKLWQCYLWKRFNKTLPHNV